MNVNVVNVIIVIFKILLIVINMTVNGVNVMDVPGGSVRIPYL
jgi:hypothetical protein